MEAQPKGKPLGGAQPTAVTARSKEKTGREIEYIWWRRPVPTEKSVFPIRNGLHRGVGMAKRLANPERLGSEGCDVTYECQQAEGENVEKWSRS